MKLTELEIKIKIDSKDHFQQIFAACKKAYGPPLSHVLQLDEYYDTPDRQLLKQDLVIRIRSVGENKTIALKSPRIDLPSGMNKRIELEFKAQDGGEVLEQLKQQGLHAYDMAEKERWTFLHNDCEIVIDHLPFIGFFLEIEGPDEIAIQNIVHALKLTSCEVVRKNYGELMREKFSELKLAPSQVHATFAAEKSLHTQVPEYAKH